jgi:Tat protein translocase TatC
MWQAALNKLFKAREKVALNLSKEDEEKPFLDHLEDLRKMFVRIAVTLLVSVLLTFGFNRQLTDLVQQPYVWAMSGTAEVIKAEAKAHPETVAPDRPEFSWKMPGTRTPQEGFMASVNVSLVAAIIIAFPLLLLFILQFVLPGLRNNERRVLWPAMGIGFGLFLTGVFFSYYSVLPRALQFFSEWNYAHGFENIWMLGDYIQFSTRFILIFGISFELPVVVMALVKLDFLSYKVMTGTRKHAIIGICIFSAVITPTQDILTLLLLAGPLYVLYEICIWLAYFLEKKERQAYPEFYADRDKDEAELEKEVDDWDKDGYTPWFSDEEDADIEDEYQQRAKTGDKPTPATETPGTPDAPAAEPTLEELARQDELGTDPPPGSDPAKNQD